MSAATLISKIKDVFGDYPNYIPYSIRSTKVVYGMPPVPIIGLQYIAAQHNNDQTKLIMGLSGHGPFVENRNSSGVIEIGILSGSVSIAGIQVMELTGIPFPIAITDTDTGGTSTVVATACRRTGTPRWRRAALPEVEIFTFSTPQLVISDGLRLVE